MNEVDVEAIDLRLELRKLIELALLSAPVEARPPVGHQLAEIREVGAVIPARPFNLAGKARACQAIFQVRQHGVGNGDLERDDRGRPLRKDAAGEAGPGK
jgi:hypothetical protein